MAARRRLILFLALAPALLASGCLLMMKLGLLERPVLFSHKTHGTDQALDCRSCHPTYEESEKAGMPKMQQCMLCHEGIDEQKPEQRRLSFLYGEEASWDRVPVLSDEIIFSHKIHVADKGIACGDCHNGIEESTAVSDGSRVFKDDCMECHARSGKANDCSVCHRQVRKELEPEDHSRNWKQVHGQVVRADTDKSHDRCSLCHVESTCASCHQDEPPRDHTNHWRHRGHGITASIDRQRCAACHRDDFCDRCHRDVSPRSHRGSWGSPRESHCLTCHSPLSSEPCFICHQGTPSHGLGEPKPAGHTAAMNCRQCHGAGQPLPHADNGDNCNACHP